MRQSKKHIPAIALIVCCLSLCACRGEIATATSSTVTSGITPHDTASQR